MQETSALWKSMWATGQARLESKAYIDGTEYTQISDPVISRAALLNSLTVGNASSATCEFTVRTNDTIPKGAEVIVVQRLVDGDTVSEWLPAGTFYISHRSKDPINGLLSLECYDGLLKTNVAMPTVIPWTDNDGNFITTDTGEILYVTLHYPASMKMLLDDILYTLGMELDPRTSIATGAQYVIESVNSGTTVNDVLKQIAAANGGNWIMTPRNKLRLVPIVSASGAASATENVVDVVAVTSAVTNTETRSITGVAYEGQNGRVVVGDETGIVVDADVSAAVATALAERLVGMTYQAYDLTGAIYDPAAEIGDYVRSKADVASVLYTETATLGVMFRGRLNAPELGELVDEYPYKGAAQKSYDRAKSYADAAAQLAAQNAANNLDLTLTQQEIFDRLTDGGLEQGLALESTTNPGPSAAGDKKLFLNLDYARFGKLIADFIQGGTLKLGGLDNVNGELQIVDANGVVIGTWNKDGISVKAGSILANAISGGTLTLGGAVNTDGQIEILDENGNQIGVWDNEKLRLGEAWNYVQLYGPAEYNGVTAVTPFYAVQTYNGGSPFEMMLKEAMLVLLRGSSGLQLNPDSIAITEDKGSGYEADLEIAANYIAALMGGTFTIQVDNGMLDFVVNGLSINGAAGASGTFRTADNKTVTVTNGLITGIA